MVQNLLSNIDTQLISCLHALCYVMTPLGKSMPMHLLSLFALLDILTPVNSLEQSSSLQSRGFAGSPLHVRVETTKACAPFGTNSALLCLWPLNQSCFLALWWYICSRQGLASNRLDLGFAKRFCSARHHPQFWARRVFPATSRPVIFAPLLNSCATQYGHSWVHHTYSQQIEVTADNTNSLWDILGEGEIKSLAQLSTDHFKKHKRPLRVAIDEAGWRFHNLSDAQVHAIRQKVPEAIPIEKAILWRVLKLMRMNIQPIFIFDGPSRP